MKNANPGIEKEYALDFLSVVRHVATEMDRVAPAALSIADMAKTYRHIVAADYSRVRHHHDLGSDHAAKKFLIERAVLALRKQVTSDGNGNYRLAKEFDKLRYDGHKLYRSVKSDEKKDEQQALRGTYNNLANEQIFYVTVQSPKGGLKEQKYGLHPLARAIPQISEKEFLEIAADIKQHGVRLPITVFDGQVLDGRHRLAIAAVFDVPLRVQEFSGTEKEARDYVISLNVKRRHLTIAQRGLIVQEMFLPEAEIRAQKRMEAGGPKGGRGKKKTLPPVGGRVSDQRIEALEDAAKQSQGLASVRTLQRMVPVRNAPETKKRIRSGEIESASDARREAEKEQGLEPTEPDVQPRTAWVDLGRALSYVKTARGALEDGRRGNVTNEQLIARIDEIHAHLDQARELIERPS